MSEREDQRQAMDAEDDELDVEPSRTTTHGGWGFVAQAHYDPTAYRDLTTVIVGAIADAADVPISEVLSPPLYEVVDVAAMEAALFGRRGGSGNGTESAVEFRYNQYKVRVEDDGWVTVSTRTDEGALRDVG